MTDIKLFFECTFGEKSHLNLAGKIVFSPVILWLGFVWMILHFLFAKKLPCVTMTE